MKKLHHLFVILFLSLPSVLFANVPGWPTDHIAMGTATDGNEGTYQSLLQRPVDAIFTYAGIDGGGDRGQFIPIDNKVKTILDQVRSLEKQTGKTIHPVIVFYAVNGSGGVWGMQEDLDLDPTNNVDNLYYHYMNLIQLCQLLETYSDLSVSVILNPDYLGELHKQCQPNDCQLSLTQTVMVGEKLQKAISYLTANHYLNSSVTIPAEFLKNDTTISDYNASLNWIMKTFAPHVTFGWQDNVWAGDPMGHLWIHTASHEAKPSATLSAHVKTETDFLTQMKIYQNTYLPDFMVFDKYERDVFDSNAQGAWVNDGYLYNSQDWDIYMQYAYGISQYFNNMPVMLWQIPGGHLQVTNDLDGRNDHGSTAPDYFLGDANLASDLSNVATYIAAMNFSDPSIYHAQFNQVTKYLQCDANQTNCWNQNRLSAVQKQNVFAILWGGGSTTGIVGNQPALDDNGWLYQAINRAVGH